MNQVHPGMKVMLFGATGMVGQGVLRECLLDAGIQPLHGVRSKTAWVHAIYVATSPLLSLLTRVAPKYMTTSAQLGRAMIKVARNGFAKPVLESEDINAV
jgi:hypothetical protein